MILDLIIYICNINCLVFKTKIHCIYLHGMDSIFRPIQSCVKILNTSYAMSVTNSRNSLLPFKLTNFHFMWFSSAPSCFPSHRSKLPVIMFVLSVLDFTDNRITLLKASIRYLSVLQIDIQGDNSNNNYVRSTACLSRSHSVSTQGSFIFNEAIFKILRPTEGFSRYKCKYESPSAD